MAERKHSLARFGDFVVDLRSYELLRQGVRIKVQAQPLELLTFLIERPGELITREQLRERLWGSETYVDFDQALNKAVKKIRAALGDSVDEPKYIQTLARRGYRFIASVDWLTEPPRTCWPEDPATPAPAALVPAEDRKRHLRWLRRPGRLVTAWATALGALLFVTAYVVHQLPPASRSAQQATLMQITFDPGLQFGATFSPDGRFIAYSSNRDGRFDIWVQQIGGTEAHKITHLPGHNWQPDWSPDGNQIVFRSEWDRGGLFVVPAFGGEARKIASFGYRPRWSPDGTQILFESTFARYLWNKLYLVTPDGSAPHEILLSFFERTQMNFRSIAWYPDGKRISVWGDSRRGREFWTVDILTGHAVKSETPASVQSQLDEIWRLHDLSGFEPPPFHWAPQARSLYFEGVTRSARNLWKVTVDPKTLRWASLRRLTTGRGPDTDSAISPDGKRLAFTSRVERVRIWWWPLDTRTGQILGEGKPISPPGFDAWMSDVSADGKKLVFVTHRLKNWQLWETSIPDKRDTLLLDRSSFCWEPRWAPDGTRVLCTLDEPWVYPIILPEGGGPEKPLVSTGVEFAAADWSPDSRFLVGANVPTEKDFVGTKLNHILVLPLAAAPHAELQARRVTPGGKEQLCQQRFSPDGRWIAFEAVDGDTSGGATGATHAKLYLVPVEGGPWAPITDGASWDDKPRWSPDGKILYFMSSRTGLLNVWGVRVDPLSGRAVGDPFQVTRFEDAGLFMPSDETSFLEISIGAGSLVAPLATSSGNIWMLETLDQ